MSKRPKIRQRSGIPAKTHTLRPGPNWPLLAVSCVGIVLTGYLSWTALVGGQVQGCSAGGGCDTVLTSRWATLLGLPTALWGLLAYAGLAAIAFVRRVDSHWTYAWTAAFFGVCYSVYLTVVSLTILRSACPYCLTSLALMSATLALVTWQRPPEMARRSWLGPVAGRGALAALVIFALHANYASRAHRAGRPDDPCVGRAPDRGRRFVLRRVVVSALSGAEATLRGVSQPSPVHRMQSRRTQYPAGAIVQPGRHSELSDLGHRWPGDGRGGVEPGSTGQRLGVSRRGQLQVAPRTVRRDGPR
jgi:uncharacterized membrane protein